MRLFGSVEFDYNKDSLGDFVFTCNYRLMNSLAERLFIVFRWRSIDLYWQRIFFFGFCGEEIAKTSKRWWCEHADEKLQEKQNALLANICPSMDEIIWRALRITNIGGTTVFATVCLISSMMSGPISNMKILDFECTSVKSEAFLMSAPCATILSASLFKVPPTPSIGPFPRPASVKFHEREVRFGKIVGNVVLKRCIKISLVHSLNTEIYDTIYFFKF